MTSSESNISAAARTSDVVFNSIEADLRAGRIKLGDRLPGERVLAQTHGVSRASVREAIRTLAAMGIVETATGSGPKSGAIVISDPAAGLSSALSLHVATNRLPVADVVQTRILLETWAAQAAASKATVASSMNRAHALLLAMDDPEVDREAFRILDVEFHVALSALAGNAVIETMMESLSGAIRGYVEGAMSSLQNWAQIVEVLRSQHHNIYEAMLAKDGEVAARLLQEHIEWFYQQATHPTG